MKKLFLGVVLGASLSLGIIAIEKAIAATAFTYSALNVTNLSGTALERYENDEAICYMYKKSMSCLKK